MPTMTRPTAETFGALVDCSPSFVEKLRSGERLPGAALLARIVLAYDLDGTEALRALATGRYVFAAWLRREVFGETDEVAA